MPKNNSSNVATKFHMQHCELYGLLEVKYFISLMARSHCTEAGLEVVVGMVLGTTGYLLYIMKNCSHYTWTRNGTTPIFSFCASPVP